MRYRQPQNNVSVALANPLTRGLIGLWSYYRLDSVTLLDVSGNTSAGKGTLVGSPTLVTSNRGQSLNFDGTTQYVSFSTPTATVSGSYTVAAWVNPNSFAGMNSIFSTREGGPDSSFDFKIGPGGGIVYGDIGNGAGWLTTNANANFTFALNTWYHIAYVVTPSGYTIYVNGSQIGAGSFSGTPLLWNSVHIPNIGFIGAQLGTEFFAGQIDNVTVHNRALLANEILSLYNNPWQIFKDQARILKAATGGTIAGLTGIAGSFASGGLSTSITPALTGSASTFSAGSPSVTEIIALIGQSSTFAIGALSITDSISLSGQSGAFTIGSLTPSSSITAGLTGSAASFAQGAMAIIVNPALIGQSAAFAVGSLTPSGSSSVTVPLIGQSATFAVGATSPVNAQVAIGQSASFAIGNLTPGAGPSVTVTLTGNAANFSIGVFYPQVITYKNLANLVISDYPLHAIKDYNYPLHAITLSDYSI